MAEAGGAAGADPRLIDLEIEKRRLECEKLRAEIAEVGQPLWKRAGYVASLTPILLAALAFLSAWTTGYFDRQRQELASEIQALEARRAELEARNQAIQAAIDDTYLRLKVVSGEATYALSHIRGLDDAGNLVSELAGLVETVPDGALRGRGLIDGLRQRDDMIEQIVTITEEELRTLRDSLDDVPASDWAKALRYEPNPDQNLLVAPDGRQYHLGEKQYLARDGVGVGAAAGTPGPD